MSLSSFVSCFPFNIFVVGGAVRDEIMGHAPHDIDLASAMKPQEFINFCEEWGFKTILTGVDHGTVTVEIDGIFYEHTTFRKDVSCDGRNATVEFANTIEEDLARRDFTINAMARSLKTGEIIDPFGGQQDITNRTLRCVGNTVDRFYEDWLRVLRAFRFVANLEFYFDDKLHDALATLPHRFGMELGKSLSWERVRDEFDKVKYGLAKKSFFQNLERYGYLSEVMPEAATWREHFHRKDQHHVGEDIFDHIATCVRNARNKIEFWGALCHDLGKPETSDGAGSFNNHESVGEPMAEAVMRRFKHSAEDIKAVVDITRWHGAVHCAGNIEPKTLKRWTQKFNVKQVVEFCLWVDNLHFGRDPNGWKLLKMLEELETELKAPPLVQGRDLIVMGLKPGPSFAGLLAMAQDLQMEGKTKEEILEWIKEQM